MKTSTVITYLTISLLIIIIALIVSCVDNPEDSTEEDLTGIKLDTFNIIALFPVDQGSIKQDAASFSKITWDAIPNAQSYRVFVYDSTDTTTPDHVINSRDNTCTISKYETNHSYYIEVFVKAHKVLSDKMVKDTLPGDTLHDSIEIDMGFVHFVFADSSYSVALIDSINKKGFYPVNSYFLSTYGYYFFSKKPDTFNIQLDTSLSQNAFRFLPDGYAMSYKIGFYSYHSPDTLLITDMLDSSINVSWDTVSGDYITKYRAYLRDFNGIVKAIKDTLVLKVDTVTEDSVGSKDTIYAIDSIQSVIFPKIVPNTTVYKISVATLSVLGPGPLDSNVTVMDADSLHTSFKMPYRYYSTYTPPSSLAGTELVGIPGGIFLMGETWTEDPSFCPGAIPVHEVVIPSFYLNKYEVTCQEYAQFLKTVDSSDITILTFNGDTLKLGGIAIADISSDTWFISDSFTVETGKERLPVVSLYWHGAAAYCNWLSNAEGLDSCYDKSWICNIYKNGYRLPTEAEFEYTASTAFTGLKHRFPWGLAWDTSKAVVGGKELDTVGSYAAYNGFYHLIGNAMEYVNDFSDYLTGPNLDNSIYYIGCKQKGVVIDPVGPREGNNHMVRGGSYASDESECVVYCRFINPSITRISEYGFRIARNAN